MIGIEIIIRRKIRLKHNILNVGLIFNEFDGKQKDIGSLISLKVKFFFFKFKKTI